MMRSDVPPAGWREPGLMGRQCRRPNDDHRNGGRRFVA